MKAIINNTIVAESDKTIDIEGNPYFPPDSLKIENFVKSDTPYTCPWKGACQYYHLKANGKAFNDAAWSYPKIKKTAIERIGEDFSKYIAFDPKQATFEE